MESPKSERPQREVTYEYSPELAEILSSAGVTVALSTYQAGKLVLIDGFGSTLDLSFHNFDRPMGIAIDDRADSLAVACKDTIWFFNNHRDVARQLAGGKAQSCFLARSAHMSGDIQAHELGWGPDGICVVNTAFSCLCSLDRKHSFLPGWKPPFISNLAAEDRCHLNGVAFADGRPRLATVLAESDEPSGWRDRKADGGCLIDVPSGKTLARGFAMPHSPRLHGGAVWLLDSGRGAIVRAREGSENFESVARFPGYTRGLAFHNELAFVGLSRIRETSTFSDIPIAEERDRLKCGMAVLNIVTGKLEAQIEFTQGIDEIFDIALLPGPGKVAMRGPFATDDGNPTIWVVPPVD